MIIVMPFLLTDSPQKLKLEKVSCYLNNSFLCKLEFSSATKTFIFLLKKQKNNHSLGSDWWEYTKPRFKENAKIFSENSSTQENITISRQNLLFSLKIQKNNHSSASDWWGNTESSFKENPRTFSKNSTTQENINSLRQKEDCKTYTKKDNFKPELNQ